MDDFLKLENTTDIGPLIKKIRKNSGITQQDLANYSGLSRIGIVKIEKAQSDIKLSTLINMAELLGYDLYMKKRNES